MAGDVGDVDKYILPGASARRAEIAEPGSRPRVVLVNYARNYASGTRSGSDFERWQAIMNESASRGPGVGVTDIIAWSHGDLRRTLFYERNKAMLEDDVTQNGFMWKPFVVLDALTRAEDGDVVFYCDCKPFEFERSLKPMVDLCLREGHVFHDWGDRQSMWTKRDAFILTKCDTKMQHDAPMVQAAWMMLKKSEFAVDFVREWLFYNLDARIASYTRPDELGKPLPGFRESRGDQSILSILCRKYGLATHAGVGGEGNKNVNNFVAWLEKRRPMTFVEIGACCFDTLLPLADKGWRGVVVEPVREWLDMLVRKPGVAYENVAASDFSGEADFWLPNPDLDSVKRDNVLKAIGSLVDGFDEVARRGIGKDLVRRRVPVNTPEQILSRHGITHVDFLKVDAEGHDGRIVMSLPFGSVTFDRIMFEHNHIDPAPVVSKLKDMGYVVTGVGGTDMYAVRKGVDRMDDVVRMRFPS